MSRSHSISSRHTHGWYLRALVVVLLTLPVLPFLSHAALAVGCDTTPDKCYTLSISSAPSSPNANRSATYSATITNQSSGGSGHQLGAANITLSSAFYGVTAGSVSIGSISVSGNTVQLRDFNLSPQGGSAQFTFSATASAGGAYTFASAAKQSNNFSGTGNDLVLQGSAPVVTVQANCSSGLGTYNDYGCGLIDESVGGTTSTNHLDSTGSPSVVSAAITYNPLPVPRGRTFLSELRTDLGGNECPVALALRCKFVVRVVNKIPGDYTVARDAVSMVISCANLCSGVPTVWLQLNEVTGVQEPLLPCLPLGTLTSPLSGSAACIDDSFNGTAVVRHISNANDWKVMGLSLGG